MNKKEAMMEDDIDIEEHDLLDNPALKNIFPDLSVLKKEIYDYEGSVKKEILQSEPMVVIPGLSTNTSPTHDQYDELFGQREPNTDSVEDEKLISHYKTEHSQIAKPHYNGNVTVCFNKTVTTPFKSNRIILGSKPQLKLLLDDVHPYLIRSKRFCKTCLILFTDIKGLMEHTSNAHSNKCLPKTNTKSAFKCNKCDRSYFYEDELKKHISQNHKKVQTKSLTSGQKQLQTVNEEHKTKENKKNHFQSVNKEHACDKCDFKHTQRKSLIRHIQSKHNKKRDLPIKNVTKMDQKKCNVCGIKCATNVILKKHMKIHGNIAVQKPITNPNISDINIPHPVKNNDGKELNNKCFHCNKVFGNQETYINHLYEILQDQKYSKLEDKSDDEYLGDDSVAKIDNSGHHNKEFIRCPKCNYYFKYMQVYVAHMIKKHKMKNIPVVKLVSYEENCYFCGEKFLTWKRYNAHMQNVHSDQLNKYDRMPISDELRDHSKSDLLACKVCFKTYEDPKLLSSHYIIKHKAILKNSTKKINLNSSVFDNSQEYDDSPIFLSILFKCNKCDIHFMFAKCATNHVEHMDMLINWKCPTCFRIFKKKDEILHTKQHSYYNNDFVVYDLCQTELSTILFNCPKCAVHFNEENFLGHFPKCGSQVRKSNYCKVCDILIDSDSKSIHEECHKSLNDFLFVESNVKLSNTVNSKDKNMKKKKAVPEDKNNKESEKILLYCHCCKSYLTGHGPRVTCHMEKKCDQIPKYICRHCGLLLTHRAQISHKKYHSDGEIFKLDDFIIFDLSGQQIKPPLPDFPKCDSCGMQFVRKNFIHNSHLCTDKNFVICQICQGKFSDAAYKLHLKFHNYSLSKGSKSISKGTLIIDNSATNEKNIQEVLKKDLIVKVPKLSLPHVLATDQHFIYLCNRCQIAFDVYDRVVEHCQAHFVKEIYKYFPTRYCEECDLEYDTECYENHCKTHSMDEFDMNNIKHLNFDLDFFLQENRIWLKHVYDRFPGKERSRFVAESIYRYEARVKLSVFQEGPSNLTVYKCAKCNCFVGRSSLFKHAKNSCFNLRKHPCSFCGLPFISYLSKEEHEKIHSNKEIDIKAENYKIVIFNREEDKIVNEAISERKKYVLHQCRNCDIIVNIQKYSDHVCDRSSVTNCKECGLLFQSNDYQLHTLKHQECNDYYPRNIKMLLCGQKKQANQEKKNLPPTFRGVVHDYTFYQCSDCQACMKDCQSARHDCDLKYKCDHCELFFVNKQHSKLHENDPDFVKSNINLIPLRTKLNKNRVDIENDESRAITRKSNSEEDSSEGTAASKIKLIKVYKCSCELSFFESSGLVSHLNTCGGKGKNPGQKCSKCDLVFTPKTLFNHVLRHHGNKTFTYKFNVINVCKTQNILYKCCKCPLHFPTYGDAFEHSVKCTNNDIRKQCTVCERYLTLTHFKEHEQSHVMTPANEFLIREVVVNETEHEVEHDNDNSTVVTDCIALSKHQLQKLDLSKYSNVLFKCKNCSFIALDQITIVCHLLSNAHDVKSLEVCTQCQYSFPMSSLLTHVYVHHNKWKLSRCDLIVQECDDLL